MQYKSHQVAYQRAAPNYIHIYTYRKQYIYIYIYIYISKTSKHIGMHMRRIVVIKNSIKLYKLLKYIMSVPIYWLAPMSKVQCTTNNRKTNKPRNPKTILWQPDGYHWICHYTSEGYCFGAFANLGPGTRALEKQNPRIPKTYWYIYEHFRLVTGKSFTYWYFSFGFGMNPKSNPVSWPLGACNPSELNPTSAKAYLPITRRK